MVAKAILIEDRIGSNMTNWEEIIAEEVSMSNPNHKSYNKS